ncbi:flagellar hook-basal body complex protein [Clostridium vincentii]|uniref:Flagellar hook protein FlgE n=1 Tax=Clostridium vincentii TaxID=52704 RepID=A0A2T0BJ95_9CLOT|nr:flagellar hook-basal body complex protein [Clostridium vincentii]PRR83975.1 Flagellar hook protein FlgE [Clostridium vincentii]
MLKSMYSGISGMKVNQTKLDVIGNNIANVNTTGFKSSRARFSDTLSQNVSEAMAPSQNAGGINASQVGLGVQLASIDSIMTQGSMQTTGRALDVAIDGNGFFMVSSGPAVSGDGTLQVSNTGTHTVSDQSIQTSGSQLMYSRDGSFILDTDGSLLTGDGYRVMGYSLTNDDSSQVATAVSSTTVNNPAGLKISFGPGSQLNGYKVVLGTVAPGTPTTSVVDKVNKQVIINGDFSDEGSLTTEQIEAAVNKGLSASGISQSMSIAGTITTYANLESDGIAGGTDNIAPDKISFAGFTIKLTEGASLNDYTFEIGEVGTEELAATVNTDERKITIQGDFISTDSFTASDLKAIINQALVEAGVEDQKVDTLTGSRTNFANLTATTGKAVVAAAPELSTDKTTVTAPGTLLGFTVAVGTDSTGNDLNGYSVQIKKSTGAPTVNVDTGSKAIVISGDVSRIGSAASDGVTVADFNAAILSKLKASNIKDANITLSGTCNTTDTLANSEVVFAINGVDSKAPSIVTLGGFELEFPLPETLPAMTPAAVPPIGTNYLDELQFVIADINEETLTVEVDPTNSKKYIIKGNFAQADGVTKADLQTKINDALGLSGDGKILVSGQSKVYSGIVSDAVIGGEDLSSAGEVSARGLSFQPATSSGSALNGYKIQIGTVAEGTKTETIIDETAKTITINGDFVSADGITVKAVQTALTKAFSASSLGNNVGITVGGVPVRIDEAASEITTGGTPVQSIGENGVVSFVDATKDLKAYDTNLKSLRIPDKVKIPGTDTMIAVKTYTISPDGVINATLEDGTVAALGQIALVSFKNPEGLTKLGGNLYNGSVNSGEAAVMTGLGTLGEDNSKIFGATRQNMLEMSNVDLAEQFTDMIVSTRAFQASSKMITTGDEILTEIINLKR